MLSLEFAFRFIKLLVLWADKWRPKLQLKVVILEFVTDCKMQKIPGIDKNLFTNRENWEKFSP